jgi:hypothetical protein
MVSKALYGRADAIGKLYATTVMSAGPREREYKLTDGARSAPMGRFLSTGSAGIAVVRKLKTASLETASVHTLIGVRLSAWGFLAALSRRYAISWFGILGNLQELISISSRGE